MLIFGVSGSWEVIGSLYFNNLRPAISLLRQIGGSPSKLLNRGNF